MFLIMFSNPEGRKFFLHNGDKSFIGGNTKADAQLACQDRILSNVSTGGFKIVEKTVEELSAAIGGVPYKIYDFNNGLTFWHGVEIIHPEK